jgi:hypothetical protein
MLRVNAVKELPALSRPALSRMGDAGASDREGSTADRRVGDGLEAGCSWVPVGVRRVVIRGPNSDQSPGGCLGGSIMLVESRRVDERRLRPQTGCLMQHLSCYPGECRHGDSAAPGRRTLHRQVSCRLRKPDWRPCTQPGWSGGRGGSRQSRPGPGEIEDDHRQHPPSRVDGDLPLGRAPSARPSGRRHLA